MSSLLLVFTGLASILMNKSVAQNIPLLHDGEVWNDDYALNDNAIDGWKYPPELTQTIGSDRIYHGWIFAIHHIQYLGYFYRQFECQYRSTIAVDFKVYLGCGYDPRDGAMLYINEHSFKFNVSQHIITNYADAIAINETSKCFSRYQPAAFIGFNASTDIFAKHQFEIEAYTAFDVGFRMINLYDSLMQEFGAISEINIQCNKINASETITDNIPSANTATSSMLNISDAVACSSMDQYTCEDSDLCDLTDLNNCTCSANIAADIIFGVGIFSYFESRIDAQENMERWFTDDIFPNINDDKSRFGLVLFDELVAVAINLDYYTRAQLTKKVVNASWVNGWLNYDAFFDTVTAEFDAIQTPNNRILVIVTDSDPKYYSADAGIVCQYRNSLASRGIRVVFVVINYAGNQPHINNYECIAQNSFDLFLTPLTTKIAYEDLHQITDGLSAALCSSSDSTILSTLSPTNATITTLYVMDTINIEIIFLFHNMTNVTTEISNVILTIIAADIDLEGDEINMTVFRNTVIIKAKGDKDQINDITQSISVWEQEIEDEIGEKPSITLIQRNNNTNVSIDNKMNTELKELIVILIVLVSVLIFIVIVISVICCYCLFITKKDENEALEIANEAVAKPTLHIHKYQNVAHQKAISVQSITGFSMQNMYGIPIMPAHQLSFVPYAHASTDDMIIAHHDNNVLDGEHSCSVDGLYGPGLITQIDEESANDSSDDDGDKMYLKGDKTNETKEK